MVMILYIDTISPFLQANLSHTPNTAQSGACHFPFSYHFARAFFEKKDFLKVDNNCNLSRCQGRLLHVAESVNGLKHRFLWSLLPRNVINNFAIPKASQAH